MAKKPKIRNERAWDVLYSRTRYGTIRYIVIHYTEAPGGTAKNNADFFSKNPDSKKRIASANFFVDEKEIWQSVPTSCTAYHCGLGGGTFESDHHPFYGKCKNANSIGIEMCITKYGNVRHDTVKRTRQLVLWLMDRYDIPADHVIRHYDVTGKSCPDCKYQKSSGKLSDNTLLNDGTWHHFKDLICE